jgi:maltooligosyltrehalose trehalohydrolase
MVSLNRMVRHYPCTAAGIGTLPAKRMSEICRRFPVGAEVQPDGSTHFRVWAPDPRTVSLTVERGARSRIVALEREEHGYCSALVEDAGAGTRYRYILDDEALADPASRSQPDGPFGPSEVVDPATFRWQHTTQRGVDLPGQVIYELHPGTFTPEGTWTAAVAKFPLLVESGITMLEVMPVSEFPGQFGWGYDGVFPYAPTHLYGTPDDFRTFIDRAHAAGLGVILDVVYNHLGPDGSVFGRYASAYFAKQNATEWGDGLNYDGPGSTHVREYFVSNASYWIDEFHLDGLRLDATQDIHDRSELHVIAEIGCKARSAARGRSIILAAENERQLARLVQPVADGGFGMDAVWNDDFHHAAVVAVTGRHEAYYSDHRGAPQELISAAKYGYLFQGQRYAWQKKRRGSRTDGVSAPSFVICIENHDQIANSGDGTRLRFHTSPGRHRAVTALMLLMPATPMLFQGQEFGATSPFLYFADHKPELAEAVRKGREEFVSQFPSLASPEIRQRLPLPHDPMTFERCKLNWKERETHHSFVRLHRDLLAMRRADWAFRAQDSTAIDGAVLGAELFAIRYFAPLSEDERLLIVNFGVDVDARSFAEPLVAPPDGHRWILRWSSEHPDYGGCGTPEVESESGWRIPGHAAVVLRAEIGRGS